MGAGPNDPNDPKDCDPETRERRAKSAALIPIDPGVPERTSTEDQAAGGLPSIASAVGYAVGQAGVSRTARTWLRLNQPDGFDCPSCAWPDPPPENRARFEFCENGARAVADEATRHRVTPEFFERWSISALAQQSDHFLNAQGRITHPMVRQPGSDHYTPISWRDAYRHLARELRATQTADRAIFYTSGRTSNEAAFLYQLFARELGTNNLPDCSNMCHESSGVGLTEAIGIGKGTVLLDDFDHADAIFVVGQNPGTNHPRMLSSLRSAKQRGCSIVAVNPLREIGLVRFSHPQKFRDMMGSGIAIADLYLQVRVGGDIALFKGIMKVMLEAEKSRHGHVFDHDFIEQHTAGFDAVVADLEATDWPQILAQSGISRPEIERAAAIAIASKATIVCWAMGITQHKHGVGNVQTLTNFLLLQGNIGKLGSGPCPVRGHSNVQGDRTMGICERPPSWAHALGERFGFVVPPTMGHDTVAAIEAMCAGECDVFVGLGGNFLSATPDTAAVAQGLSRCRLTAHVSTKLNRSHLVTGEMALILPCLGRTESDREQFVTLENSMGIVHTSRGTLPPASDQLRSEPQIVAAIARATLGERSRVEWETYAADYDRIRDEIAQIIPGFEHYNHRVRQSGGFLLQNGPRSRSFPTTTRKARFIAHPLPPLDLEADTLWMTTVRSHDQFNTTIYGLNDRYRGIMGHRHVVMMNRADIASRDLEDGSSVTLVSLFNGQTRRAPGFVVVAYDIPVGNVATYFPEANALIPLQCYADGSRTPTSKAVKITIERERDAE